MPFARTSGRYGEFQITVVDGGLTEIEAQLDHDLAGNVVDPDRGCVWWQRDSPSPPDWEAVKPFGNVLLAVDYHAVKRLGANFQRLVEVLDTLRDPPAVATSRIPALDTPCAKRGITPGSSTEGSCRLSDQTLVEVNANHLLRLPGIDVRLDSVQTGSSIDVVGRDVVRSRGRFVIIRYTVTDHTFGPISDLDPDARLATDSRLYPDRPDLEVLFTLPDTPGLVHPGSSLQEVRVFDLPLVATRQLDAAGALEVAGIDSSSWSATRTPSGASACAARHGTTAGPPARARVRASKSTTAARLRTCAPLWVGAEPFDSAGMATFLTAGSRGQRTTPSS